MLAIRKDQGLTISWNPTEKSLLRGWGHRRPELSFLPTLGQSLDTLKLTVIRAVSQKPCGRG